MSFPSRAAHLTGATRLAGLSDGIIYTRVTRITDSLKYSVELLAGCYKFEKTP